MSIKVSKTIHQSLETLGLPVLISQKELKARYKELSKIYHPDVNKNQSEKMCAINEAYSIVLYYMENYKFTFSSEEILKQYPQEYHVEKFKF